MQVDPPSLGSLARAYRRLLPHSYASLNPSCQDLTASSIFVFWIKPPSPPLLRIIARLSVHGPGTHPGGVHSKNSPAPIRPRSRQGPTRIIGIFVETHLLVKSRLDPPTPSSLLPSSVYSTRLCAPRQTLYSSRHHIESSDPDYWLCAFAAIGSALPDTTPPYSTSTVRALYLLPVIVFSLLDLRLRNCST